MRARHAVPARLLPVALLMLAAPGAARAQSIDSAVYAALKYRTIGPEGNRTIAIVGVPGDPRIAYVGAASGGIFKTTDAGAHWVPVFDDQDVSSVSALALDPSNPNVVWAGTGETFLIRPAVSIGEGIYRSDDAGKSWRRMGLEKTGRIGRIVVDPRNSRVVYACALGHAYGPQEERGVFRSRDGGATWQRVLFVDPGTGCSELDIDPRNGTTLFAGMWPLEIKPWKLGSGGPSGGVYVSRDAGEHWEKIEGHGFPSAGDSVGKVAVRVAPSDPERVYALLELHDPTLFRSDDGGRNWRVMSRNHDLAERAPYYTRFAVDPSDPDRLYFVSVRFTLSRDGGRTIERAGFGAGGDLHDVWIDPRDPARYMTAHDGGASLTLNRGESYQRVVLPIAQMYHVHTDNAVPYHVYGNRQDGYSYEGPSNGRSPGGTITEGMWHSVGGCESGFAVPDTLGEHRVWSGCYDGGLEVYEPATRQVRNVRVWPVAGYGWPPAELKERWHWTFPIAISPHDHERVYVGSQRVHVTQDGGRSWSIISPDLTLNRKDFQGNSGGVAVDNLMTFDGSVLYSLAESPLERGLLWAGSNDGQVSVTRDGGTTWTNVTRNLPPHPPFGTVANLEPSRFEPGTAYLSLDLHQMADFDPYIYRTRDYGRSWTRISGDLPRSTLGFVHVVREDPGRPGMLYAGTERSVYFSLDDGLHWSPLRANLPPAPVYWLTVQPHFDDLVVGTYGRGYWILDDVGPLRQLRPEVLASEFHLFAPRPAYRFQPVDNVASAPGSNVFGRDPEYGADLNFYLKSAPSGPVSIAVTGPDGAVVRTLRAKGTAGLNRVWWDLRHEPPTRPVLRVAPPGRPWVNFDDDHTRPLVSWDLDLSGGQEGPLVPPGRYSVRVSVDGRDATVPLTVLKDPNTRGTEPEIAAQTRLALKIRDDLSRASQAINRLEWTRRELEAWPGRLPQDSAGSALRRRVDAAAARLVAAETALFDVNLTGAREDAFRSPMRLWGRLSALGSDVFAHGSDFAPTRQQEEAFSLLDAELDAALRAAEPLLRDEMPALLAELQRADASRAAPGR